MAFGQSSLLSPTAATIIGYTRNALSVVSDVYRDLNGLLQLRHVHSESFRSFELRLAIQNLKFNASGAAVAFYGSRAALLLLCNSGVHSAQRVSILAAVSRNEALMSPDTSNDDYFNLIKYEAIASILRQCDDPNSSPGTTSPAASANHTKPRCAHDTRKHTRKGKLSPEQLRDL